jgi:hypothetical protein
MKNKFLTLFMAFSVFFMAQNFVAPKAQAAVGLIIKHQTATTIGGISAAGSAGVLGGALILGELGVVNFTLGGAIILAVGTAFVAAVGLIILDDKTVADMNFVEISDKNNIGEFSDEAMNTYNEELAQLNAIRKTIQNEMNEKSTVEEARNKWNDYKGYLSQSTVEIAEFMAKNLTKDFKIKK